MNLSRLIQLTEMGFPHNLVVKVIPEYVGRNFIDPKDFFPRHIANIVASLDHLGSVTPVGPEFDSTLIFFFHGEVHTNFDVVEFGTAMDYFGPHRLESLTKHGQSGFQVVEDIIVVQPCISVYILYVMVERLSNCSNRNSYLVAKVDLALGMSEPFPSNTKFHIIAEYLSKLHGAEESLIAHLGSSSITFIASIS